MVLANASLVATYLGKTLLIYGMDILSDLSTILMPAKRGIYLIHYISFVLNAHIY